MITKKKTPAAASRRQMYGLRGEVGLQGKGVGRNVSGLGESTPQLKTTAGQSQFTNNDLTEM